MKKPGLDLTGPVKSVGTSRGPLRAFSFFDHCPIRDFIV
jgi:hypothetical protein